MTLHKGILRQIQWRCRYVHNDSFGVQFSFMNKGMIGVKFPFRHKGIICHFTPKSTWPKVLLIDSSFCGFLWALVGLLLNRMFGFWPRKFLDSWSLFASSVLLQAVFVQFVVAAGIPYCVLFQWEGLAFVELPYVCDCCSLCVFGALGLAFPILLSEPRFFSSFCFPFLLSGWRVSFHSHPLFLHVGVTLFWWCNLQSVFLLLKFWRVPLWVLPECLSSACLEAWESVFLVLSCSFSNLLGGFLIAKRHAVQAECVALLMLGLYRSRSGALRFHVLWLNN